MARRMQRTSGSSVTGGEKRKKGKIHVQKKERKNQCRSWGLAMADQEFDVSRWSRSHSLHRSPTALPATAQFDWIHLEPAGASPVARQLRIRPSSVHTLRPSGRRRRRHRHHGAVERGRHGAEAGLRGRDPSEGWPGQGGDGHARRQGPRRLGQGRQARLPPHGQAPRPRHHQSVSFLASPLLHARALTGSWPPPSPPVDGAAKQKGQKTKAFMRVLKYSNGGVLEVIFLPFSLYHILSDCFPRLDSYRCGWVIALWYDWLRALSAGKGVQDQASLQDRGRPKRSQRLHLPLGIYMPFSAALIIQDQWIHSIIERFEL